MKSQAHYKNIESKNLNHMESKSKYIVGKFDVESSIAREIANRVFDANILDKYRKPSNVMARMTYARMLQGRGYTTSEIGASIGKNHSTIVHYARTLRNLYDTEVSTRVSVDICVAEFLERLGGSIVEHDKSPSKELAIQNAQLYFEVKTLENRLHSVKRLRRIIDMIGELIPSGREREAEKLIKLVLGGLSNDN